MPSPEWNLEYQRQIHVVGFEISNARYEATNRVDQLEMEEVTFERHQRLPSRWHYAINKTTYSLNKIKFLVCVHIFLPYKLYRVEMILC
jgi:hypothetical protein